MNAQGTPLAWNASGRARFVAPGELHEVVQGKGVDLASVCGVIARGEGTPRTYEAIDHAGRAVNVRIARLGGDRAILVIMSDADAVKDTAPLTAMAPEVPPVEEVDDDPTHVIRGRKGRVPKVEEPARAVERAPEPEPVRATPPPAQPRSLPPRPLPSAAVEDSGSHKVVDLARVRSSTGRPPPAPPARPRMSSVLSEWGLPFLLHDRERVIDANLAVAKLLGLDDAAPLVGRALAELAPEREGEGRAIDVLSVACDEAARLGHHTALWTVARVDGTRVPVEVSVSPLRSPGQELFLSVWQDRATEVRFRDSARERERLALALARSIRPLLSRSDVDGAIREALGTLGAAVAADRCFVVLLREDPRTGQLETTHRIAWAVQGVVETPTVPPSYDRARSAPIRWLKVLKAGGVLVGSVREFPDDERARLERYDVRSCAVVPIRADGSLLGFVGVDACQVERTWTPTEIEILRGMADSFAGAFARQAVDRALREGRDRYEAAVRGTDLAVWEVDATAGVLRHVDGVDRLLDLRDDEVPRTVRDVLRHVHPDDRADVRAAIHRATVGADERIDLELRLRMSSGVWKWLLLRGRVTRRTVDGVAERATGTLLDIDERKRMDDAVRAARVAAEAASGAKSRFLANMSHEIRTPLNAVIGLSTLLGESKLTDSQREMVDPQRTSGEHLLALLNQVLDVSRIESGHVEMAMLPFDLRAVVHEVRDLYRATASEKGLRLDVEVDARLPQPALGDATRMRQVLVNLVDNAVKFTERGLVAVRVRCPDVSDLHRVRIDVADTGPGIAPEDVPHVFGIFDQVDPSDARRHGGSGLGLSISHRLVDLMGGAMSVDTSPGGGSTFHVDLTLGVAPAAQPKPGLPAAPALPENLRILVVEDNIVNQKVAVGMLGSLGCKAKVVDSGERALDNFDREQFDVVLMDIQMPEMDGLETTRRIRERVGDGTNPWIIAVTAAAQHEDRQRSLDSGMNDYLAKPVRIEDLQVALSRAVNAVRG